MNMAQDPKELLITMSEHSNKKYKIYALMIVANVAYILFFYWIMKSFA